MRTGLLVAVIAGVALLNVQWTSAQQEGDSPPKVLTRVEPAYTEKAAAAGLKGIAVLPVAVDENGVPVNVEFVAFYDSLAVTGSARVARDGKGNIDRLYDFRSYYAGKKVSDSLGLDSAAEEAVSGWRFVPATKNGKPVAATTTLEVAFLGPRDVVTPNDRR